MGHVALLGMPLPSIWVSGFGRVSDHKQCALPCGSSIDRNEYHVDKVSSTPTVCARTVCRLIMDDGLEPGTRFFLKG